MCIAGDTLATNTKFTPQLYEVTYVLKETNFIGDETQADMTYTAQSSMHLDVVQPTQALKFNSLNLDITTFSYLLDDWMDVCLCGYQYQCLSHDCKEMVRPDGYARLPATLPIVAVWSLQDVITRSNVNSAHTLSLKCTAMLLV